MDFTEDYKKMIEKNGQDFQILHCVEEMGELTHALCRYMRQKQREPENSKKIEELKDLAIKKTAMVLNLAEQMRIIFGEEEVDKTRQDLIGWWAEKYDQKSDDDK